MALDIQRSSDADIINCQVVGGQMLPLQAPGQQGPLRVPAIAINFGLTKRAALELANKLQQEASGLPDESDLTVAHSLASLEPLIQADRKFRA